MGRGIAQVAAAAGWEVRLFDVNDGALESGMKKIRDGLTKTVEKGGLSKEQADAALGRLRTAGQLELVAETQLVIEAAPENADLKLDLFKRLGHLCKPEGIFAENYFFISVSKL